MFFSKSIKRLKFGFKSQTTETEQTMEKVKLFIVEDEAIIAESIKEMVNELGYRALGIEMRAEKAWESIKESKPDLCLLDINLKGEKDGVWLAGQIKKELGIPFIFITSLGDKLSIDKANSTSPYGYLLKPLDKNDLYAAIEVALNKHNEINFNQEGFIEKEQLNSPTNGNDSLFIKDEYLFVKLNFSEIIFVKASSNYLEVVTRKKKHLIKGTLKSFKESLPPDLFFQTHRSYLININEIENFGSNYVTINGHEIPLVKQSKDELMENLKTYAHNKDL